MEKKEIILARTEELLIKNGYKNLRTDDIARESGISKRTLYEHFSSKSEIIEELLTNKYDEFIHKIEQKIDYLENDSSAQFIEVLKDIYRTISDYFAFFNTEFYEEIQKSIPGFMHKCKSFESKKIEFLEKLFKYGHQHNKIREDADFMILYLVLKYSLENIMRYEVIKELPYSTSEVISKIHKLLMSGTLTEEANIEFSKSK